MNVASNGSPTPWSGANEEGCGPVNQFLDAVVLDIGGTLVAENLPGTSTSHLVVELLPRVVEDLTLLSTMVRLGAATNTVVMSEGEVRALLGPVGIDRLLEVVVTSADVGAAKPDPTVLLVALQRLGGIEPGRALFIGDQPTDEAAARAAGMPFAPVHPDGVLATVRQWTQATERGRRWARPVSVVGDTTSAAQRSAAPDAWRLSDDARAGLYQSIHSRRDIRRFRPDPVEESVLRRILEAAHAAPSVGHSQPWRFIIVTDASTRERAGWIADQERLAQAAELTPQARRQLLDLQLEGIREAPVGIVVCCDRRTPAAGVLGRRTFPDADVWSCMCAIQNLWLSARAEGLGVGWVTLFPPRELEVLLSLPTGVQPLGWLCVGWPDERPPEPGLERAGWSSRLPLDSVVLDGQWPVGDAGPAAPISKLRAPTQHAVVAARDVADQLLTPLGSLGVLDRAIDRVVALGGSALSTGTLILVGGHHVVTELGVSAFPSSVTDAVLDAARAGKAVGAVAARGAGLSISVFDAGWSTGNLRDDDALDLDRVRELVDQGAGAGRQAANHGLVDLGEVGVGNTTVAAALSALVLGLAAEEVTGLGSGADAAILDRKKEVIGSSLTRVRGRYGTSTVDPLAALAHLGGPELSFLTGVCLGAADAGTPVVLDGMATSIAALLAVMAEPAVASFLVAGQLSRELAHGDVLGRLGLEPLLDLRLRSGEGVGASLASGLLLQGLRIRCESARTV